VSPVVSIIIFVKDSSGSIDRCLKGIFAQEGDEPFEVIVIDSGSSDDTVTRSQAYPVRLYEIPAESFNHGGTRNLWARWARGEFVVFITPDSWPSSNAWLASLLEPLKDDPRVAAVYGMQVAPPGSNINPLEQLANVDPQRLHRRVQEVASPEAFSKLSPWERRWVSNFDNCTSCIRAEVLRAIPFPETPYGEDLLWCKEALLQGYRVVYEPEARIYHYHRFNAHYTLRRFFIDQVITAQHFEYYYCRTLSWTLARSIRQTLRSLRRLLHRGLPPTQVVRWAQYNGKSFVTTFWGFYLGSVYERDRNGFGLAPWERVWLRWARALWAEVKDQLLQHT